MEKEQVRPDYYKVQGPYEVHKVQEAWGTHESSHYVAGAIEYLARWDKKGEPVANLKKAMYLVFKEWCRQTYGVDEEGVTIMGPLPDFGLSVQEPEFEQCDSYYYPRPSVPPISCWRPAGHPGAHEGLDGDKISNWGIA